MPRARARPAPHGPLPGGGTVRPITRWGTPVMHRPQQPVDGLRRRAASPRRRHGRDDVRRGRRRAGGLPGRRGPRDVRLRLPRRDGDRTVGVVCNPVLTLPEGRDRQLDESDEGCLSFPGAFVACARPDFATVTGTGLDGEPVDVRGRRAARPLPAARDRPHARHRLRRPAADQGRARGSARRWRRPPTTSRSPGRRDPVGRTGAPMARAPEVASPRRSPCTLATPRRGRRLELALARADGPTTSDWRPVT